jgi:hypothetical protein
MLCFKGTWLLVPLEEIDPAEHQGQESVDSCHQQWRVQASHPTPLRPAIRAS